MAHGNYWQLAPRGIEKLIHVTFSALGVLSLLPNTLTNKWLLSEGSIPKSATKDLGSFIPESWLRGLAGPLPVCAPELNLES